MIHFFYVVDLLSSILMKLMEKLMLTCRQSVSSLGECLWERWMREWGTTEERRSEMRGKSEQGLGVVSCSRKHSIKEEPDSGNWDFAWRQVTVGLPRTYSKASLEEPKHTSKATVVPKCLLRRKNGVQVSLWPPLSPWSHLIKQESIHSHWQGAHPETYVHTIIVILPSTW